MKDKIQKPKEFTDTEAEAYTRYLTTIPKPKKKTPVEELLERLLEKTILIEEWIKKKGLEWR